jgi:hypothetical protein
MAIRFRPWDSRRRFVCRIPASLASEPFRRRWIALHAAAPAWAGLFGRALELMLVDTSADGAGLGIGKADGRVTWRPGTRWTVFALELTGYSSRKRALIAAALAKAARYEMSRSARPGE